MGRTHRGYTLTELLIVVVMVGALTLFALPKFSGLVERNNLDAAREELTAAIATARAAAVQKGRSATMNVSGNQMWVTVQNANGVGTTTVVTAKSMMTLYSVTVTAEHPTVTFDMRGFATPRLGSLSKYVLTKGARRDSICLTSAGQIMPRGCSL